MLKKIKNVNGQMNGSALVAVLLVMLMISAISISIITRTTSNLKTSIDTRKSQTTYQTADQRAEAVLNAIREFDKLNDTPDGSGNVKILDQIKIGGTGSLCEKLNSDYHDYAGYTSDGPCTDWKIKFYNSTSSDDAIEDILYVNTSISTIVRVAVNSADSDQVGRAVSVPVQTRVDSSALSILVKKCNEADAGCSSNNGCNAMITLTSDVAIADVASFIVKKYTDSTMNWATVGIIPAGKSGKVEVSGDSGAQTWYSIKAKNAKNFMLDSNDVVSSSSDTVTFPTTGTGCTGTSRCLPPNPNSSIWTPKTTNYSCCGGTECYTCLSGNIDAFNNCNMCSSNETLCSETCHTIDNSHCGSSCFDCVSTIGGECSQDKTECVCSGSKTMCGGTCVETNNNPEYCGSSCTPCIDNQYCNTGTCTLCPSDKPDRCDNQCVDKDTDTSDCGSCGNTCLHAQDCINGACVTPTYTLGGNVSGLSGTLVLRNNGGDDKSISSNGVYTFPTALAQGSSYNATVYSLPNNQSCIVNNGSGTVNSSNITNINVACSTCAAWNTCSCDGKQTCKDNGSTLTRTCAPAATCASNQYCSFSESMCKTKVNNNQYCIADGEASCISTYPYCIGLDATHLKCTSTMGITGKYCFPGDDASCYTGCGDISGCLKVVCPSTGICP